ncbi:hypothetical protein FQA39_LY10568 [Lamprigera yunnana]|nr:hypothetical protein FQA39_LY10568 [Lamprigera yunnana]
MRSDTTLTPLTTNSYQAQPYLYTMAQQTFRGEEVPQQPLRSASFTKVQSSCGGTIRVHIFGKTAGSSYPLRQIDLFIDENKRLMRRMYGDFTLNPECKGPGPGGGKQIKRSVKPSILDFHAPPGHDSNLDPPNNKFHELIRTPRKIVRNNQNSENGKMNACESKV